MPEQSQRALVADQLLTKTIASHFEGARIEGQTVDTGASGLRVSCTVDQVRPMGATHAASLRLLLSGGPLGDAPIFASLSGYGDSPEAAIVKGGCEWASVFAPVLLAGASDHANDDTDEFQVIIDGRSYRVIVDGLDRAMFSSAAGETQEPNFIQSRQRLGGNPWLVRRVTESGALPILPNGRASVLSVFIYDAPDSRVVEVKVNGADWLPAQAQLEAAEAANQGVVLLRELALLLPQGPEQALDRGALKATLRGATLGSLQRRMVDWPGWSAHAGQLAEPALELDIARLERTTGRLPEDYRRFLLEVQAEGPGPGYGLVSPLHPGQLALAEGEFDWVDGTPAQTPVGGALLLAHAGCGVAWLLIIRGPKRGEVWVDASCSDGKVRRVATSFDGWYRDWLDALVRDDEQFVHWDARHCATPKVLGNYLKHRESEGRSSEEALSDLVETTKSNAISIKSRTSPYFEDGVFVDPCQCCEQLVHSLGLSPTVFAKGVNPFSKNPG